MRALELFGNMRQALRDEDGTVSIEFVLVFPLLALWFIGSFVWFDSFRSNSLTAKTAYTLSDMASRMGKDEDKPYATLDELDALFDSHTMLLPPRIDDGWLRVSSICFNGSSYRVLWSYLGDDTYAAAAADPDDDLEPRLGYLTDETIPTEIMPPMSSNDSIILTETFATWTPLADWVGMSESDWRNRLVTRPRYRTVLPLAPGDDIPGYPHAHALICPADEDDGSSDSGDGEDDDDDDDDGDEGTFDVTPDRRA